MGEYSDSQCLSRMRISGRDTGSTCKSVGVAQETRDHNYFSIQSVVNEVRPVSNLKIIQSIMPQPAL